MIKIFIQVKNLRKKSFIFDKFILQEKKKKHKFKLLKSILQLLQKRKIIER